MKDKFKLGLITGFISTAWIELMTLIAVPLKFHHNYWDYASFIAFRHKPEDLFQLLTSIIIQIFFSIQLGLFYVLFENKIKTRYNIIKGSIYGGTIWFLIQAIIAIFKVSVLSGHGSLETAWEFGVAIGFGIINAWVIKRYKKKNPN